MRSVRNVNKDDAHSMQDDTISRQAAIDEAEEWIDAVYFEENDKCARIAIQHVINGLKELPSAQPSVSKTEIVGDVISRQAAIELVGDLVKGILSDSATISIKMSPDYLLENLYKPIRQMPSAQPEPQLISTSARPPKPFELVLIQDRCGCYELNMYIPPRIKPKQYPNGYWG